MRKFAGVLYGLFGFGILISIIGIFYNPFDPYHVTPTVSFDGSHPLGFVFAFIVLAGMCVFFKLAWDGLFGKEENKVVQSSSSSRTFLIPLIVLLGTVIILGLIFLAFCIPVFKGTMWICLPSIIHP